MNLTYYIGAGASYHSLPVMNSMRERMEVYSSFLKNLRKEGRLKNDFAETFINELDELIEITEYRTSIDVHAKLLSISNQPDSKIKLLRLKALLSSYFLFEQLIKPKDLVLYSQELDFDSIPHMNVPYKKNIQQAIKTSIDKRYHTFWTEYLTQDRPRDNLKVISWNYDMQFEASYSHIKNYGLELTQQNLQVFPSTISNIDINVVDLSTQG